MSVSEIDARLQQVRGVRSELVSLLQSKITQVRREREEMISQYDEEIGALEMELAQLGVEVESRPSDVGVKAYNYLRENAGQWFNANQIMRAIRCEGAVASVVLSKFILDGRVVKQGEYRSTVYGVPSAVAAAA